MLGAQLVLGRREILWNEPFQMLPMPVEAVSHSSSGYGGPVSGAVWGSLLPRQPSC